MNNPKTPARNRQELIIEVWEELDCESVGAVELERIQTGVSERFGAGAVDSPAGIARLLADEGAVLRHPEVLEADTVWRRQRLADDELDFVSLPGAIAAIRKLEALRKDYLDKGDMPLLDRIYSLISEVQEELGVVARSKTASDRTRSEVSEVLSWLAVWRATPDLFNDWLELRLASPEFRETHPDFIGDDAISA